METTLSGGYAIRLIQEAKAREFEIVMFYIGLGDPLLNVERVAIRVRNGGHYIPTSDIMHRHHSSIKNLLNHLDHIDTLLVIDNSSIGGEVVLQVEGGTVKSQSDPLPKWVLPIKEKLNNDFEIKID